MFPYRKIFRRPLAAARTLIIFLAASLSLAACSDEPSYRHASSDPYANFDALADIIASRYCFLREKNIDWRAVCVEARKKITPETNEVELFFILSDLLDNLKDGHVNLISQFNTSYYRKWWSDYPQDFNKRTLEEYYLKFGGLQTSGMRYCMFLPDSIGYVYYPSFSTTVSESALDYVLAALSKSHGLIIDVRDNGGGLLTNVPTLVSRFTDKEFCGGYIRHKTGPGEGDFSDPYPVNYSPCGSGHIAYRKAVDVLTNRSTFSAANNFVAIMKQLPQVTVVGARTGGGGGLPFTSELPNGWAVRFSASPITDANDQPTEFGVDPTPGFEVHCEPEDLAAGHDAILDTALRHLAEKYAAENGQK